MAGHSLTESSNASTAPNAQGTTAEASVLGGVAGQLLLAGLF